MPPKTYNLRNREPSNGDDAHVDISADTQTVDSEPSEINTIHSLILLQQEKVASLLSFGNDLLTNYTDFDDISSVTSELAVAEAELVRLTKSLALHISTTDFAPHANKLTSIKLDIRRFKVSVARSKRSSCSGSNSNDSPAPAAATSDLPSSSSSHHPHGDDSTAVPPLTNAVSFSSTTFEPNMPLSNNLQTNPFGITQSVDTSTHENAIDPASISTTNTLHDNADNVPPQRRLTLPKFQPPVFQGDPLAWLDWFGLFSATIDSAAISQAEKIIHLQNLVSGEPKALIDGYGCNPAMYQYALSRFKSTYGKPDRIVMSFLQRLQTFRQPSTDDPNSITNYANFLSSLVDTFTQLNFLHDIHSTVNLTSALLKLPADVRLNWNRHVLSQNIKDPSLRNFAPWLQNFATVCRDSFIPFSDTNHNGRSSSSTNARAQGHNSKTPFVKPSSQFSLCPEKKGCVYLGSCEHFKAFSPIDRKNYAKKYHLCFNCLKGHNFNDCKSTKVCQQPGCMKKHHTLLHIDRQGQNQIQSSTLSTSRLLNPGLRPIVPVTVSSCGKTADVFALLDTGNSVSLITKKIAEHLVGHLPESSPILLEGVNTTSTVAAISLDLTIAPYNAAAAMPLRNVLAVPTLNLQTFDSTPINSLCQQYPHLQHVSFPYLKQSTVDLLIGSDQFDLIHSRTVIRGPPNTPCAMSTKLGWTVAGRSILPTTAATNVTNLRSRHEALFQQVQEWMHIDCSGITSSKKSLSAEDQQALSILKKTTKLVDGHYEIGLLWKNHVSLPNNKWVAQKQLSPLEIKLARKPQLGSLYEASIATDIEK